MFTGIIEEIGEISGVKPSSKKSSFTVRAKKTLKKKKIGDSIAVNGACVTVTKLDSKSFTFDAIEETLNKTNLKRLKNGDKVNLESALKFGQSLDGHLVQGHIDTEGKVLRLSKNSGESTLRIQFPKKIGEFIATKGSITINGVSLTVSALKNDYFEVKLIPHTLRESNLKDLVQNDKVNLEVDLIARYLKRLK